MLHRLFIGLHCQSQYAIMRNLTLYTAVTKFDFGKYKGTNLYEVLNTNPLYIKWCVENIECFFTEDDLLKEVLKSNNCLTIIIDDESKKIQLVDSSLKTLEINNSKIIKYKTLKDSYDEYDTYSNDYYDDWAQDMSNNWLAYAAGTDDSETMNDVYWNLD